MELGNLLLLKCHQAWSNCIIKSSLICFCKFLCLVDLRICVCLNKAKPWLELSIKFNWFLSYFCYFRVICLLFLKFSQYIFNLRTVVLIKVIGLQLFCFLSKREQSYQNVHQLFWLRIVTRAFVLVYQFYFHMTYPIRYGSLKSLIWARSFFT